jgi:predicted transcriptional regulator
LRGYPEIAAGGQDARDGEFAEHEETTQKLG